MTAGQVVKEGGEARIRVRAFSILFYKEEKYERYKCN